MKENPVWVIPALIASLLLAGRAGAQYPLPGGSTRLPGDQGTGPGLKIKRRTVSGTVRSVDGEKKQLVMTAGKGDKTRDVPVDVGPSLIKAGKGGATFADIRTGDRISVYGEVTVQGGLRAMEITLPAERMSIPPPSKSARKPHRKKKEAGEKDGASGEKKESGTKKSKSKNDKKTSNRPGAQKAGGSSQ